MSAQHDDQGPGWSILELMGHRRLGGYVTQEDLAGVGLLRIDIPGPDGAPAATQYYAPAALYCLTPCTEETARAVAARNQPQPAHRWELAPPATDTHPTPAAPHRTQHFRVFSTPSEAEMERDAHDQTTMDDAHDEDEDQDDPQEQEHDNR